MKTETAAWNTLYLSETLLQEKRKEEESRWIWEHMYWSGIFFVLGSLYWPLVCNLILDNNKFPKQDSSF